MRVFPHTPCMLLRTKEVKLFSLVLNSNGNLFWHWISYRGMNWILFYRWFSHLCFICTFRDYIKCIFFVGDNFSERTILILNNTLFLVWNCVSYESHRDMSYLWHLNRLDALWLDTKNHDFVLLASEGRFVFFRPFLSRSAWNSASD